MTIYLIYVLPNKYLSSCSYYIVKKIINIINANFEFNHHELNLLKKEIMFHWSTHYFIFSETPVVLEEYIWALYMNTQSHWLFLFDLYKKHKQDLHYFMCDMIFFMSKN